MSNDVSVISTPSNVTVATIGVGAGPNGIAVNPAGTRVYVANGKSNNVSVIDTSSNTVVSTVGVGSSPDSVGLFIGPGPSPPLTPAPPSLILTAIGIMLLAACQMQRRLLQRGRVSRRAGSLGTPLTP